MSTFADMNLPQSLAQRLIQAGLTTPTPVQQAAIPLALKGQDIMDVHRVHAYVLESLGYYGDAINAYKMASDLAPNLTYLYIRIGVNYRQLQQYDMALEYFAKAGMTALREKSLKLTGYLEFLINDLNNKGKQFQIISPVDPTARGCQLSILTGTDGKELFDYLAAHGVICDWREPNVIRVAPVPLYNSFEDVFGFTKLLIIYSS